MKYLLLSKLTSRKFWLTVTALVIAVMVAIGAAPDSIEKITGVIGAFGVVITYLFAEGMVDRQSVKVETEEEKIEHEIE